VLSGSGSCAVLGRMYSREAERGRCVVHHAPFGPKEGSTMQTVFLAGSHGKPRSVWQDAFVELLRDLPVAFLDPRRPEWAGRAPNKAALAEQVQWEQHWKDAADVVVVYNSESGLSPARMIILGQCTAVRPHSVVVCCCKDLSWQLHTVEFCRANGVWVCDKIEDLAIEVRKRCATGVE
jgi:hypothetical protein